MPSGSARLWDRRRGEGAVGRSAMRREAENTLEMAMGSGRVLLGRERGPQMEPGAYAGRAEQAQPMQAQKGSRPTREPRNRSRFPRSSARSELCPRIFRQPRGNV